MLFRSVQVLCERKNTTLTEWIFSNPLKPELPVNPRTAYSRLKALLKSAGLPSIRFHDLRHTFSTHALSSGVVGLAFLRIAEWHILGWILVLWWCAAPVIGCTLAWAAHKFYKRGDTRG